MDVGTARATSKYGQTAAESENLECKQKLTRLGTTAGTNESERHRFRDKDLKLLPHPQTTDAGLLAVDGVCMACK